MPLPLHRTLLATYIAMAITPATAMAETGQTCIVTDAESHANCLSMIGAVRELTQGSSTDPACVASSGDDLATTEAVIDWIKTHPERTDSDLAVLIREALIAIDPCAQGALIPTLPTPDPLDVE
nr:hypothetical protein [uncultured Dongia sp.]